VAFDAGHRVDNDASACVVEIETLGRIGAHWCLFLSCRWGVVRRRGRLAVTGAFEGGDGGVGSDRGTDGDAGSQADFIGIRFDAELVDIGQVL
jgi:hypothetical protein